MEKALTVAHSFGLKVEAIYPNSLDLDLADLMRMDAKALEEAWKDYGTSVVDIERVARFYGVEGIGPCCGFPFESDAFINALSVHSWG